MARAKPSPATLKAEPSKVHAIWTLDRVRRALTKSFGGSSIVVLANREPVRHDRLPDDRIAVRRSASGLVTALEPLLQLSGGVWVAHGSGTADLAVVDGHDRIEVGSGGSSYHLRRVWLTADEEQGYYNGFSNEGLWPFCHRTHVAPVFRSSDFHAYRRINKRFAEAAVDEASGNAPVVLVQDYHFALAPSMIRQLHPHSTIIAFWHIPWPRPCDYAACPWGLELLEGLLGSCVIGFQTPEDVANFLSTCERFLPAQVDRYHGVIRYGRRQVLVRAYPVSVEWPNRWVRESLPVDQCRATVCQQLELPLDVALGVGVDRLDYTKGLNEKLHAIELLLESQPELCGRFVLVQIAEPSRESLPAYRALRCRLAANVDRINRRFGTGRYRPVVLRESHHEPQEVYRFLRAADFCYVNSLHDGMNLVAKEFVSARDDERGVLVLSEFAGCARELPAALLVNPYAAADAARALDWALRMPVEEQECRMRALRTSVAARNIYTWAGQMVGDAARQRRRMTESPGADTASPMPLHRWQSAST